MKLQDIQINLILDPENLTIKLIAKFEDNDGNGIHY